jgi:hypothetical protein
VDNRTTERRLGWDRRGMTAEEANCLQCCRFAGAAFHGIQKGHPTLGDMCLFGVAEVSTTLCLPVAGLTPLAIKNRLADAATASAQLSDLKARLEAMTNVRKPAQSVGLPTRRIAL